MFLGESKMKLNKKIIKQIINEVRSEKKTILLEEPIIAESSFNRIKGKIDTTNVRFVVMSADRHNFSRNENDQRYSDLKSAFQTGGYPFTELQGAWNETDKEGNEVRVIEKSLIATEEDRGDIERGKESLYNLAKRMTKEYEQDAFIYGWIDETGERQIQARRADGSRAGYGTWESIEPISADAPFWSRVRGSTFVFKEEQDGEGYGDMFDPYNPKGHPEPKNEYYGKDKDHKYPEKIKRKDDGTEDVKFKNKMEEVIEVDAPNSVIEAMIKAEMHKDKKIKFVRRNK